MSENSVKQEKSCICCGHTLKFQYKASPLDYCLTKEYTIYKCDTCGYGITDKVEDKDLTLVYEEGAYDPKEKFWHKILRPAFNVFEIAKVNYLKQFSQPGKSLLEVGTGKGSFLKMALQAGYDAYGIEPSSRSYNMAKLKVGERVFNCTLEEMHLNPQINKQYDYIMLWHVLEHLKEPEKTLALLKTFLKPGGLLIVGVPNFSSYQSIYGGANWYHLDPPRHLSHFTTNSAEFLFKKNGMAVKKVVYNSYFQNFLGEIITINNLFLPHKNILLNTLRFNNFYLSKTSVFSRIINLLGFFLITSIIFIPCIIFTHFTQWIKRSGTIVVVAQNTSGV